jgi:hypothetical protein
MCVCVCVYVCVCVCVCSQPVVLKTPPPHTHTQTWEAVLINGIAHKEACETALIKGINRPVFTTCEDKGHHTQGAWDGVHEGG